MLKARAFEPFLFIPPKSSTASHIKESGWGGQVFLPFSVKKVIHNYLGN